ncbi:MAG: XdhC family protein [Vallitaleaceae bacterium]|nr:XdhC family protein [Vallitaleaceae bacterium]
MGIDASNNVYGKVLEALKKGEKAVLLTKLVGNSRNKQCFTESMLENSCKANESPYFDFEIELLKKAQESLNAGNLLLLKTPEGGNVLFEPFFPEPQLIVFGGGHIALPLVEFGQKVGFLVTVVDDRLIFANAARFPSANKVLYESFEKCFDRLNLNNAAFVVIITRGHKHDMTCLKQALQFNTAYLGMIGSKRRIQIIREQLLNEGYTKDQLAKVNAPIGVEIGAVTPEEIAVSIIAQVIGFRRKKDIKVNTLSGQVNWPEFDRAVIEELSKNLLEPKALVTILSTKGSVPRKAGAKMIVFADGRILGSIGGGCSEKDVINCALTVIKSGQPQFLTVDMTGDIAEDDGMVCGGIMEVLIE